ncbi:uncharacterized protein LOC129732223 isoform X2 [Wyeomyia smithii]|uniref:uncharacterized protein LOC129732223 isoform X2 n=1 Tax=Wyeomyia smithii TaxID=174621 RepID=UPI002467C87A|nr:uncharacterized protein LOC129732223 isoform X2 [Wyeomyia smithii]
MKSATCLLVLGATALLGAVSCASIASNLVEAATPRIATSEQLLSSIVNDCFEQDSVMSCLKGKVLIYLDGVLGLHEEQARAFEDQNVDKVIFDRVARVLASHEFKLQLPEDTVVSYRADKGINLDSLPLGLGAVLLLLKLKMKALMPIIVALVGLKAMKALILSKLAITLVLGFLIAQLVKKSGLGMPMMSMMPMMPPAAEYGAPAPATTEPPSSYNPSSWEPQTGGPYSRVWEPSTSSSSHSLAYSSYYPSSSGNSGSSYSSTGYNSGSSGSSSSPSSSSSSSSSTSAHAY